MPRCKADGLSVRRLWNAIPSPSHRTVPFIFVTRCTALPVLCQSDHQRKPMSGRDEYALFTSPPPGIT